MKKAFIVIACILVFGVLSLTGLQSCAPVGTTYHGLGPDVEYTPADMKPESPDGLLYLQRIGLNWWEGAYHGNRVLIHFVVTWNHVNVQLTFVPN